MADKCVAPVPTLVWLGCEISAERMMLRIPDEKLHAVLKECVHLLPPAIRREWVIEFDSCLMGRGGAFSEERCFPEYNPDFIQAYPLIHEHEILNLVVTLRRTLRPDVCAGLDIVVNTDNAASAHALGTGRVTDATFAACAREIWLLAALGSFTITIRHKPGADLIFADGPEPRPRRPCRP